MVDRGLVDLVFAVYRGDASLTRDRDPGFVKRSMVACGRHGDLRRPVFNTLVDGGAAACKRSLSTAESARGRGRFRLNEFTDRSIKRRFYSLFLPGFSLNGIQMLFRMQH